MTREILVIDRLSDTTATAIVNDPLCADFFVRGTSGSIGSATYKGRVYQGLVSTSSASSSQNAISYRIPPSAPVRSVSFIARGGNCRAGLADGPIMLNLVYNQATGTMRITIGDVALTTTWEPHHFEMVLSSSGVTLYLDGIRVAADLSIPWPSDMITLQTILDVVPYTPFLGSLVVAAGEPTDFPMGPVFFASASVRAEGTDTDFTALGTNKVASVTGPTWTGGAGISGEVGQHQSYYMSTPAAFDEVVGVIPFVVGQSQGSGAQQVSLYVKSGDVREVVATAALPTVSAVIPLPSMGVHPTTGEEWDADTLANLEVGVRHDGTA